VQAADCRAVSGVVEGLGFDRFWLTSEAGLGIATPTLGLATDLTVVREQAEFRIAGPNAGP
jgi:hypothetical protein